eukprot:symbB.v1.2.011255.t2/scaffold748.1/size165754/9
MKNLGETGLNQHAWSPMIWAKKEAPVISAACTGPLLPVGGARHSMVEMKHPTELKDCSCCKAVEASRMASKPSTDAVSTLTLMADLEEVLKANEESLPSALLNVFGADGLSSIFGSASAKGAKRLWCGGFNHVFMIELGGKLAKCIRPHGGAGGDCSEVLEAERLRHHFPSIYQDNHILCPQAAFLCKANTSKHYVCEVLVFNFIPGCQSIADLCRDFERTHPCGVRRSAASCSEHRALEDDQVNCEHFRALRALVRQAASLGRHFQELHGRRHGDFKADNVLVDQHGHLLLSDFLSPFCVACDRDEFRSSIQSGHPICQQDFEEEWQAQAPACRPFNEAANRKHTAWLAEEMRKLTEASSKQSLFGPLPDLLQNISSWSSPSKMLSPRGAFGSLGTGAGKVPVNESPSFTSTWSSLTPTTTISNQGFSWPETFQSSGSHLADLSQKKHKAWGHANTAPLVGASSPIPSAKSFFTEPNLLEHAKLLIAATSQDSPATSTWQTPSWAGSSLSSTASPWSPPSTSKAGHGDSASYIYKQANKSPPRIRRSSAPSPFFPSSDIVAMHKASLRMGEVPQ